MEPPTTLHDPKSKTTHTLDGERPAKTEIYIDCEALRTSEAFVDFEGYLTPCCHIGRRIFMRDRGAFDGAKDDWMDDVLETFDARRLNIATAGYPAARASLEEFIDHLRDYWLEQHPRVCRAVCGKKRPVQA